MNALFPKGRRRGIQSGLMILVLASLSAAAAPPREVILLHSFGRQFEPYDTVSETFRTQLAEQLGDPVEFHDVPLESDRFEGGAPEGPLVDYLTSVFAARRLDLVVTIGGPAARFGQTYRPRLFPLTPMLIAAVDQRLLQLVALTTNDAVVAIANDLSGMLENILQVLPETTNVAVVAGNSPHEQFWLGEMRQLFQPFTNRVDFVWFNNLSFTEMQQRAATLPARSAIFYVLLAVDAEGVPQEEGSALAGLHAVANAPIFGLNDSQMGRGIVGGPLMPLEELSRNMAKVAVRMLRGEPAGSIQSPTQGPGRPIYDWRELRRWRISEARLPTGSGILFRESTLWELHKGRIIAVISVCLAEAAIIVLLITNLVKRRRAQGALRESEERLSLAVAAANVGIWMSNAAGDRIWASPNWRQMFGFPADGVLNSQTVLERIHPDDRATVDRAMRQAIDDRGSYVAEFRVVLPDQTERWIASRGRLCSEVNGTRERILGASVDISERKRAMESLRRLNQHNELILASAAEGILGLDLQGNLTFVNPAAARMLGYTAEELLYRNGHATWHHTKPDGNPYPREECLILAAFRDGAVHRVSTEVFWRKDGTSFPVEYTSTPIYEAGRTVGAVVTFEDVTERKEAEAEVQRQREELAHVARVSVMGELATSVAHELNQPLGSILCNAEAAEIFLQQDPPALDEIRAILADIRKDDERAGEVIRRMRALLRKHELERRPLQINSLVEDVLRLVSADASLRQVVIAGELSPDVPPIQGDHIHLQQVLLNLIMNSMEAMTKQPPEKRRLTVRTSRTGDGAVEILVADSGPGIAPDEMPRLFEPFFTTKPSGIGIGLSICRKIIEAHHGRIWAENHPVGGAIFRVTLPAPA